MNKTILWVITILIIIVVGVILYMNPLTVGCSGIKCFITVTTEYGNTIAEDFPSDFPGDPNIVQITKNQKTSSLAGGTEFVLEYLTTKPASQTIQDITKYALSKDFTNINDGSGTNEEGNEYLYFSAQNNDGSQKISVTAAIFPASGGALSSVAVKILNK